MVWENSGEELEGGGGGGCTANMYIQPLVGAVSPEELIRYSHRISLASSAVSPVGWQPSERNCD